MRRKEVQEKLWDIVGELLNAELESEKKIGDGVDNAVNYWGLFKHLRKMAQDVHLAVDDPDYELDEVLCEYGLYLLRWNDSLMERESPATADEIQQFRRNIREIRKHFGLPYDD
jgi:hypothetical protein